MATDPFFGAHAINQTLLSSVAKALLVGYEFNNYKYAAKQSYFKTQMYSLTATFTNNSIIIILKKSIFYLLGFHPFFFFFFNSITKW